MRRCIECDKNKISNFCLFCFKKTANKYVLKIRPAHFEVTFNRTKFTHKRPGVKKFLSQAIIGWMPSTNHKKHPRGVFVHRFIDRENNRYKEDVVDRATGIMIESKDELLSEHKYKKQSSLFILIRQVRVSFLNLFRRGPKW